MYSCTHAHNLLALLLVQLWQLDERLVDRLLRPHQHFAQRQLAAKLGALLEQRLHRRPVGFAASRRHRGVVGHHRGVVGLRPSPQRHQSGVAGRRAGVVGAEPCAAAAWLRASTRAGVAFDAPEA
jgi:hypothetical protein